MRKIFGDCAVQLRAYSEQQRAFGNSNICNWVSLTPVLMLWGGGNIDNHVWRLSYCTLGFGAITRRDLRILSLPHDSPRDNLYACVIWVHAGKATYAQQNYLADLATKKSGGTVTHLHTWWQDGRHNRFPLYISLVSIHNS